MISRIEIKQDEKAMQGVDPEPEVADLYMRVRYDGKWYIQNPDLKTLLLIGTDEFASQSSEENTKQSDFLMLLIINTKERTYKSLQISRDTMAEIPLVDLSGKKYTTKKQQLALAFAQSSTDAISAINTSEAVSNLLYGIDVDHFVVAGMDIVPVLNDIAGGVPVYVEDDFSAADPSIVQGSIQVLNGEQALHFVRSRSGMDEPTNLARMERQRVYIDSLRKILVEKAQQDDQFILRTITEVDEYVTSDCSINQLAEYADIIIGAEQSDMLTVEGEVSYDGEYAEFYPDEAALQKQVIELFFVEEEDNGEE